MTQQTLGCVIVVPVLMLIVTHAFSEDTVISTDAYQIPEKAEDVRPLLIGAEIPALSLRTSDGDAFDLNASLEDKPAVIIFYRGGWCPYCNVHLSQLKAAEAELVDLGFRVVAISPDQPEHLAEAMQDQELTYTLLSDSDMEAARGFGVAFQVDDETIEQYKGFGIDLEASSGKNHHLLPVPAVFIVGKDGRIRFNYVNPDYKVRLTTDVLLAAAKMALE